MDEAQCAKFNAALGSRPYNWDDRIAQDRKPINYLYTSMYKTEPWPQGTGTVHLHEKVYVARPNDPGLWNQFAADPCLGTPCSPEIQVIGHGVDQLRYEYFYREYASMVFCLDQLNTIEAVVAKMAAIAKGYQKLPEHISSGFLRTLTLRKAGNAATQSGLWLSGMQDSSGNPVAIDVSDNMFAVAQGQSLVGSRNTLFINLNANGGLTALSAVGLTVTNTTQLAANMGQLTMEYLINLQDQLIANGYHDAEWLSDGKFSITMDANTSRRLRQANPALSAMYVSADFAKAGAYYSLGMGGGCGDWLFKPDPEQMRFRFRSDLDGKDFSGGSLAGAIWVEQVFPFQNTPATFGIKPVLSMDWINAALRLFHVYNREARSVQLPNVESVNSEMKFGLARSFMGKWTWRSPDYFTLVDPNTGQICAYNNPKHNQGYFNGEYRYGIKTEYPEIERLILALGEASPFLRVARTNTAPLAPVAGDYQSNIAYDPSCATYTPSGWSYPPED